MNRRPVALVAALLACAGSAAAGDVTGRVAFSGNAPKPVHIMMNADPVCARQHRTPAVSEAVVINKNGTLKNVLVYVSQGAGNRKFAPPGTPVVFDQKGCQYIPHVLGIQVGQELEIRNDDPTLHNVHALCRENPQFNIAQPRQGMMLTKTFEKPEVFKVKCEVHTWMGAYVGVFSHPYFAVTGDDGSFTLKNLPAGEYTIEAWHEKYGTQSVKVKVAGTGTATANFRFEGK